MAGFKEREKRHFPLQNIKSVVNLVRDQLESTDQPNLALVSIALGAIEHALTVNRTVPQDFNSRICLEPIFPVVELSTVEALYQKFVAQIKGSVDLSQHNGKFTTRELVKKVSDVLWAGLSRSFKDKAHLQSLYAYLTGNKLDCFGVALGVVAACQVLGLDDVHLSLSEDHAWVVFGEHSDDTAEVTWHGKGNEDKRGQSIVLGVAEKSWLYLNGHPVVCTRQMEIASIVSSINPGISATMDSVEMGSLQQELLWLLYDMGHLEKYPMALGNLGDLEEISTTAGRPSPKTLYLKAIDSAVQYYEDFHVYPYTYMGGFCYRNHSFKEALRWWAGAANVIRKFNYSREDEEIYKEFMEISNELIPMVVKLSSETLQKNPNEVPLLKDPECYALVLQFYDGICQWEEDSSTPVLHIGWAKHIISSLAKFEAQSREHLELVAEGADSEDEEEEENGEREKNQLSPEDGEGAVEVNGSGDAQLPKKRGRPSRSRKVSESSQKARNGIHTSEEEEISKTRTQENRVKFANGKSEEDQIKNTIQELESKVQAESQEETLNPNIDALAKACGESILNPEYLISGPCGGEPFTANTQTPTTTAPTSTNRVCTPITVDFKEFLSSKSNGSPFGGMTMDSMLKAESPADMLICKNHTRQDNEQSDAGANGDDDSLLESTMVVSPRIMLHSCKMKGLKHLLTSEKLNASAIKLQLTAQSVTLPKHSKNLAEFDMGSRRKRLRRE